MCWVLINLIESCFKKRADNKKRDSKIKIVSNNDQDILIEEPPKITTSTCSLQQGWQ